MATSRNRSRASETTAPAAGDTSADNAAIATIKEESQYYIRLIAPVTYPGALRSLVPAGTQQVSGWVLKQLIGQPGLEKYEELVDDAENA